ncbi:rhodanese-like domain-containing protein [Alkalicoccus saliphilus]|jgi:rhodanese-related sulfurtransferase|uniref:Rhodanese-like domain-containing protein n=1 Tax=Alkalicoccus saliphilus TaxID=200989 RepID=A0A2T4U307_9BACI|nr:rhodanese-like domain-containing protein [Alkalicoccus saliphilus]PTL37787.1 rhodanese-like domain-containing protein [Alkalicoccus saliphilus]
MTKEVSGVKQVDKEQLKDILKDENSGQIVIDVREPEEYEAGHIPGVPLVPMSTIPDLAEGFDQEKEYVFICRSGNRSQRVSEFLKAHGYTGAVNFEGGMLEWDGDKKEGDEVQLTSVDELKNWKRS